MRLSEIAPGVRQGGAACVIGCRRRGRERALGSVGELSIDESRVPTDRAAFWQPVKVTRFCEAAAAILARQRQWRVDDRNLEPEHEARTDPAIGAARLRSTPAGFLVTSAGFGSSLL